MNCCVGLSLIQCISIFVSNLITVVMVEVVYHCQIRV